MLEVKNLEYGYNGKRILKDINLKAKSGTIVSIIGPNGSGKTTLLKCISGINRLWAGSISMDGREIIPPIEKKCLTSQVSCPRKYRSVEHSQYLKPSCWEGVPACS